MRFPKEMIQPLLLINPHILITDYSGIPTPFRHTYIEFLCSKDACEEAPSLTLLPLTPQVCLSRMETDETGSDRMTTEIYRTSHTPLNLPLTPGHLYRCILPMHGNLLTLKKPASYPALGNILWFYSQFGIISPRPDIRHVLDTIIETRGACTMSELTERLMCSDRHLRRIFTENIGFGPKEYCRFVRLQEALSEMVANPKLNISHYIRNLTYSDQAHFQRDFREFTGITPRSFLKAYSSRKSAST